MKSSQYLVYFLLFILFIYCKCNEDQLNLVMTFSRNGARAPLNLDVSKLDLLDERWMANEEITANGIREEYLKGAKLKRHYIDRLKYISRSFNEKEMTIFSADFSAAMLTTYSQLISMYPIPTGPRLEKTKLKHSLPPYDLYNSDEVYEQMGQQALPKQTQAFPVKTFPPENNYFGLTDPKNCKGVGPIVEKNKLKKEVKDFIGNFTSKYAKNLTKIIKVQDNFFNNYDNVFNLCDAVYAGYKDNRNFTLLTKNGFNTTFIKNLYKDCKSFLKMDLYEVRLYDKSSHIAIYSMSNMMRHLIRHMDYYVYNDIKLNSSSVDREKFSMFTGHEADLAAFMYYLNIGIETKLYFPKFGSALVVEFYKKKNAPAFPTTHDFYVTIYLNEKTLVSNIRYTEFKMKLLSMSVKPFKVNVWCGLLNDYQLYFFIAAMFLLAASSLIGLWIYKLLKKHKKDTEGEQNPEEALLEEELLKEQEAQA